MKAREIKEKGREIEAYVEKKKTREIKEKGTEILKST